jgi:hypothetical protein
MLYVYVMPSFTLSFFLFYCCKILKLCNFYCLKQGFILTSEIDGTIQMKSYLTGNPEIRLALNEDLSIGTSGRSIYVMLCSP